MRKKKTAEMMNSIDITDDDPDPVADKCRTPGLEEGHPDMMPRVALSVLTSGMISAGVYKTIRSDKFIDT